MNTERTANRPDSPAPPGSLSSQERDLLIDLLEQSRDSFLACVGKLSPSEWSKCPGDGGWSIHECAEHIVVSEQALRDLVRQTLLQSSPAADRGAAVQGKDGLVVQAMRDRSRRAKTFDFLEPTGRWADPAVMVERFQEERAATLAYARTTMDPLHHHVAPLGPFGELDGYQWLLLLASHTERHTRQIEAVHAW